MRFRVTNGAPVPEEPVPEEEPPRQEEDEPANPAQDLAAEDGPDQAPEADQFDALPSLDNSRVSDQYVAF